MFAISVSTSQNWFEIYRVHIGNSAPIFFPFGFLLFSLFCNVHMENVIALFHSVVDVEFSVSDCGASLVLQ